MSSSVVLITGASSGLGQATAQLLHRQGYHVFGTSRKVGNLHVQDGIEMIHLDVRSDESVKSCVEHVLAKAGRIDALVNNAGYVLAGALEETSIEEAKEQFETNFWGAVRMTQAVLPLMRAQSGGYIINVTSVGGLVSIPFEAFYAASKFALEGYTEGLRYEVEPFNIKVALVEPGYFNTPIPQSSVRAAGRIDAYRDRLKQVLRGIVARVLEGSDPTLVAQTILQILQDPYPRLRYPVGPDAEWTSYLKSILPEELFEKEMRRFYGMDPR